MANQRDGDSADVVAAGAAVGNGGGGVRLGPTSYRLVSAKNGGDTVGAASDADRPGVDGGATSWTVLLRSGDLALAAPELRFGAAGRRQRWSCERSGGSGRCCGGG